MNDPKDWLSQSHDDLYLEGPTMSMEGTHCVNVSFYVEHDDFDAAIAHLTRILMDAIGPLGPECGIKVVIVASAADAPVGGVKFSIN